MGNQQRFDAIVIGAGFGGIYALKKLRDDLGLKVRVYDKAGGVGGTWYWNRYPGAMSDTEAFVYQFSFDKDMLQECDWKNRYWDHPDRRRRDRYRPLCCVRSGPAVEDQPARHQGPRLLSWLPGPHRGLAGGH